MGKKKTRLIGAAIFLVIVVSVYFYDSKELYGNDKESIVKVINSIEGYEDKRIKLLKMDDFNNVRIVGFLSDNNPSYIEFHRDGDGNYVWKYIEHTKYESLGIFSPISQESKMMMVTNQENKIAKMQVEINGNLFEQEFTPYEASVTWLDYPHTNEGGYEFRNYKFFNEEGDLIKRTESSPAG